MNIAIFYLCNWFHAIILPSTVYINLYMYISQQKINCLTSPFGALGSRNLANIFSAEIYVASLRAPAENATPTGSHTPQGNSGTFFGGLSMYIERFGQTIKNIVPASLSIFLLGPLFIVVMTAAACQMNI